MGEHFLHVNLLSLFSERSLPYMDFCLPPNISILETSNDGVTSNNDLKRLHKILIERPFQRESSSTSPHFLRASRRRRLINVFIVCFVLNGLAVLKDKFSALSKQTIKTYSILLYSTITLLLVYSV